MARGMWWHDFQHNLSQSQMCLDSPVCHSYHIWTDWAPEKVSAFHSASWHARNQIPRRKFMCCFPHEGLVEGLLWAVLQWRVLEHGLPLLTTQGSLKLREITGPFVLFFLWTCSPKSVVRFCSWSFLLCHDSNHGTPNKGRGDRCFRLTQPD